MTYVPPFIIDLTQRLPTAEAKSLQEAAEAARQFYAGRSAPSGEDLTGYVEEIVRLLLPLHPDSHTLITTLLKEAHSPEELAKIEKDFGKNIRSSIAALAILSGGTEKHLQFSPAQLKRMALAFSDDVRILLICIHERLHLLKKASRMEEKQRIALARDVLDVFAPLCAKLGVYAVKYALEAPAFVLLYPQEAAEIERALETIRQKHGDFLGTAQQELKGLMKNEGINCTITTRKKPPYSIFRKMNRKGITNISDLHDLFGIRIVVDSIEDCYRILGLLHHTYCPILHRIKDYIGMPKPNGYRSLHTTLLGLSHENASLPVEVQIRTQKMLEEAEYGVAAHWNYKEHGSERPLLSHDWKKRQELLSSLSKSTAVDEPEVLTEELSDRIYVLTPNGDAMELPRGATPLDFAFHIHTDIGLHFRMAMVNDAVAPIDKELENGDLVEILTKREANPSEQWIQIVRTKEARQKLKQFFAKNPHRKALA